MMKSYLRFEPKKTFGVISSPQCNVIYDFTGNLAFTGAVQDICVWNLRQASQIETLSCEQQNYPYKVASEVTILERSPDKSTIAAGYADGAVRIFNYITKTLVATFHGHRSGIASLCFNADGTVLATGGSDTDIILWDLVTQTGACKLRGHKDAVTGISFITRNSQKLIVSVSKDTLLKVWDVETRSCLQTIVGHRCEIWSLAVLSPSQVDSSEQDDLKLRIVTGSSDEFIRGYRFKTSSKAETVIISEDEEVLEYYGCVVRANPTDKCNGLYFNKQGTMLAAQCSGKSVEIFRVRNDADAKKKLKRRQKRLREKSNNATDSAEVDAEPMAEAADGSNASSNEVTLSDEMELLHTIRCAARVRGFAFSPLAPTTSSGVLSTKVMIGLITNSLEIYTVPVPSTTEGKTEPPAKQSVIDLHGHRSDVRVASVSGDGLSLATCSSEGVKTWSTKSHLCISTCAVEGYCVSMNYAPGGRYILVGTKEGHVMIFDTASGEAVFDEAAHEGSVWSIAVRPDGKGFMTGGADKLVKFWDFSVTNQGLGASMSRHLVMAHDVLSVRYSPNKSQNRLLVAVGLLDNTVKIFYDDSLKFFLSLYGHKLPIMCLDISYDSTILVSGSADKTIKIWGLDFGDCHRSLIAHEDSVTCLKFQPNTHYFFSSGKDGVIKYWDADRFEQILFFPGHKGSVWAIDLSPDGSSCYSVGQDRTIRLWERGEDLVFVEEERERALEAQVDLAAEKEVLIGAASELDSITANNGVTPAALKSIESVKGGESLMDALDLVEAELAAMHEFEVNNKALAAEASAKGNDKPVKKAKQYNANPLLLGLSPHEYMLRVMKNIKAPDLEQALIILPFHYVVRFISMLIQLSKYSIDIEIVVNCAVFLIRLHLPQIQATQSLREEIAQLRDIIGTKITAYRNMVGSNIAGLKFAIRMAEQKKNEGLLYSEPVVPVNKGNSGEGNKKKRKKAKQQHHD